MEKKDFHKRTWAKINLDAIRNNVEVINSHTEGKTKIMAIVKADAYGHGAPFVARELAACGIDFFGVSSIDEAVQLRENGINQDVFILGYTAPSDLYKVAENGIVQTAFDLEFAKNIHSAAKEAGKKIRAHIKIDTGMNRIGFKYVISNNAELKKENAETLRKITETVEKYGDFVDFEGIFTHFAVSDDKKSPFTDFQFDSFTELVEELERKGIRFKIKHACNSGGCINFPRMYLDYVRCGIILYGLSPSKKAKLEGLTPAMELKTTIAQTHKVAEGETVSYDRTYKPNGNIIAATIPIGYADGFSRLFSNSASVLVKGKSVPVIGRVCMDQTVIDVTSCENAKSGDVVTIFGEDCGERISVDDLAEMMETINYEVVCLIGKRVPRIFCRNGVEVGALNYIVHS